MLYHVLPQPSTDKDLWGVYLISHLIDYTSYLGSYRSRQSAEKAAVEARKLHRESGGWSQCSFRWYRDKYIYSVRKGEMRRGVLCLRDPDGGRVRFRYDNESQEYLDYCILPYQDDGRPLISLFAREGIMAEIYQRLGNAWAQTYSDHAFAKGEALWFLLNILESDPSDTLDRYIRSVHDTWSSYEVFASGVCEGLIKTPGEYLSLVAPYLNEMQTILSEFLPCPPMSNDQSSSIGVAYSL